MVTGVACIHPAAYNPEFTGFQFSLPVHAETDRPYRTARYFPNPPYAFAERPGKPVIAVDTDAICQNQVEVPVIPEFVAPEYAPGAFRFAQIVPEQDRARQVQFGEQEKLFRVFFRIAVPAIGLKQGRGHNQKAGGHQIRQKERVKVEGKAEFFVIIGFDHHIYKQIKIVTGLDKDVS
jgi:hypothetical protein